MKFMFVLIVGVTIGYFAGFSDARKNEQNVVQRMVSGAGGNAKSRAADKAAAVDSVSRP